MGIVQWSSALKIKCRYFNAIYRTVLVRQVGNIKPIVWLTTRGKVRQGDFCHPLLG